MYQTLLKLLIALTLSISVLASGYAQSRTDTQNEHAVLPVWNKGSGKVEALLYLEPTGNTSIGTRWNQNRGSLDTTIGLSANDSLGLLCNSSGNSITSLASHCMLASLGNNETTNSYRLAATAAQNRPGSRLSVSAGTAQGNLPSWMSYNSKNPAARIEQHDLTILGQKDIGSEAFVSIGGTYARARLISLTDLTPALAGKWNSKSLSVGGGYGAFSANIIGRVVDAPGNNKWEGVGIELSWRTPWSGQLTVGAENVVTRGKNPFSPGNSNEGTVPYVRYEQGL